MAYHATPSLSWGQPDPTYPHSVVSSADAAHALIKAGESVHVPDEDIVRAVLARFELDSTYIEHRIHFAKTGELLHKERN